MVSEPPAQTVVSDLAIDELEHQALDLLDELHCGALWIAAQRARGEGVATRPAPGPGAQDNVSSPDEPSAARALEAAIIEAGEDPERMAEAERSAEQLLARLVAELASGLLDAAASLAETEARGNLTTAGVAETRRILNASPELSPALAPAVELTGMILGLDRRSIAWAVLICLGEQAHASAPARLRACADAIAERLDRAHSRAAGDEQTTTSKPLRVFRSASMARAGASIRARALASEHPELLDLATELVGRHRDPLALVEAFDAERAALEAARAREATSEPGPEQTSDGPKRKFTWVHLVLALIILGLTLWHYLWR